MDEPSRTEAEYVAAITGVLRFVQDHLNEDLTPHQLADVACFSQHHFHRIFRAVVGESVMDHVRRLRLEQAAYRLRTTRRSIGEIAMDAGYGAQEAFTRVFQVYFGIGPRVFRGSEASYLLPAASAVHFGPNGFSPLRRAVNPEMIAADALCPFHRTCGEEFEAQWERLLSALTGLASFVYPIRVVKAIHARMEDPMTEALTGVDQEIDAIQHEIETAKQRLIEARRRRPKELVRDYSFKNADGSEVHLSALFGDKDDLIVVHNMGTGCSYCTMWADGFTGLVPHLADRAAFVVCSPDKPEVQKRFAEKRGWNFRMVSAHENSFTQDMGFWESDGPNPGPWPGVSTFRRDPDGRIYRIAKSHFGPGDDFCAVWPFLDMLSEGANGWEPKYNYGGTDR